MIKLLSGQYMWYDENIETSESIEIKQSGYTCSKNQNDV